MSGMRRQRRALVKILLMGIKGDVKRGSSYLRKQYPCSKGIVD